MTSTDRLVAIHADGTLPARVVESVQDIVAAFVTAGANVTKTYDDNAGTLTIAATGGGTGTTDPEVVRDTIAAALSGTNGITVTANDAADTIVVGLSGLTISQVTGLQTALDGTAKLAGVTTTATTDGALAASKHNPVDATSGARTMTLANASAAGLLVSVEKTDATTNTVTVTGNIRGSAGSVVLVWSREAVLLASKADGSWWPVAGHKTKASLDAAYVQPSKVRPVVRLGVFPESANANSEAEYVAAAGEPVSVLLVPYNYLMQPDTAALTALNARGVTPAITWMPNGATEGINNPSYTLSSIISGTYDSYMTTFLNTLKGLGFPMVMKWGPEMNGNWQAWSEGVNGNTTGQFALAWKHVRDLATSLGVTNLDWQWAPTSKYLTSTPLAGLYPGAAYVDSIAVHGYNYGSAGPDGLRTMSTIFDATFDEIATFGRGKPMWLGEVGTVDTSGEKAGWITDFFNWIIARGIAGFVWYNSSSAATDHYDWRVNSSPAATAAFTAGMVKLRKVAQATGKAVAQADGPNNWTGRQNFYGAEVVGLPTPALPTPDQIGAAPATEILNFFTANTTIATWNAERHMAFDSTSALVLTVPTNATVSLPVGTTIDVSQNGTGQVTITPAAGVTVNSRGSLSKIAGQFGVASLRKYDTNTWLLFGDLA